MTDNCRVRLGIVYGVGDLDCYEALCWVAGVWRVVVWREEVLRCG